MASAVDIANRALQKLGSKSIVSLTEDSKSAREMNRAYESIRDLELQKYPWVFARKRAVLTPLSEAPAFGYSYAYQLPTDYLRIVKQMDDENYEIEGKTLLTDQATSWNLVYIRKVTDVNDMDPVFREVLAAALAADTCESFTQSKSKKEFAVGWYDQAVKDARKANAIIRQARGIPDTSWNYVRD